MKVKLNITDENNHEVIKLGINGALYFVTNYNGTDNIFNSF